MKKVMFLLAVAGMFAFAACNNATEPAEDTTPAETTVVEEQVSEVMDSTAVETPAEEAPVEATVAE